MTGYGIGTATEGPRRVEIEIRSVNSRFGDVRLRIPADLAPYEAELRRRVLERARRGRIEVQITIESGDESAARLHVNRSLAGHYVEAAERLRSELDLPGEISLSDLLRMPGVLEIEASGGAMERGPLPAAIEEALEGALRAHDADRRREGARLRDDLETRFAEIERLRDEVGLRAGSLPLAAQDRLRERIRRLLPDADVEPGRLEQELAIQADRCDITEELVRLAAHLQAGRELLSEDSEPAGKRLEFLLQEIGRETNTIGSKSTDLEITRSALAIKAEIEKLREQAQNVE